MKAVDEPAYLTVGTDVSAKYRGAFCEAKIKTVKRMVKVKVTLKGEATTQVVQDDQVKGALRVGSTVEVKTNEGLSSEAVISKLTDASLYTVVFDDGDEKTLRRTSLCLKGERHFAESETLDQLPLTNPEHFGTPVIGKKSNRGGRRSSQAVADEEHESSSSDDEEDDRRRLKDELLGKVCSIQAGSERCSWYLGLVVSPSCNEELTVKKDQCLVRSFSDSKFYTVARRDVHVVNTDGIMKTEFSSRRGHEGALVFLRSGLVPEVWKMDMSQILDSSSSGDEDNDEEEKESEDEEYEDIKKNKKTIKEEPEEEPDPEERDHFLQQLYKFMEDRGTPINKPPVLGYKDLNLFKLFRLVYHLGGCHNIESGTVWKQVYMDLGIPVLNSAASYNVKTAYRKYLYGFEEYCRSASITFRTIHHNNPRPPSTPANQKAAGAEPKDSAPIKTEDAADKVREEAESESESEKEEMKERHASPRGRRRCVGVQVKAECKESSSRLERLKERQKEDREEGGEGETSGEEQREVEKDAPTRRRSNRRMDDSEKESEDEEEEEQDEEDEDGERRGARSEDEEDGDSVTGTKVRVKYGRGKTQKVYEANIKKTDTDDGEQLYLVHYYGWNVRYDEWVRADRIIWPVDKGGTKKRHRKKVKNKEKEEGEREEEKAVVKMGGGRRGRPQVRTTPTSSSSRSVSKTPSNESRSGSKTTRTEPSPATANGDDTPRRRSRRSSGMDDSDRASNEDSGNSSEDSESEDSPDKKPSAWSHRPDPAAACQEDQEEGEEEEPEEEQSREDRKPSDITNAANATPPTPAGSTAITMATATTAQPAAAVAAPPCPSMPQEQGDKLDQSEKREPEKGEEPPAGAAMSPMQDKLASPLPAGPHDTVPSQEVRPAPVTSPRSKGRRSNLRETGSETPPRNTSCTTPPTTTTPNHTSTPPRGVLKRQDEPMVVLHCLPTQHLPAEPPTADSDTDSAPEEEVAICQEDSSQAGGAGALAKRKASDQRTTDKKVRLDRREEGPPASPKTIPSPVRRSEAERRSQGAMKGEEWLRKMEKSTEAVEERVMGGAAKEPEVKVGTPPLSPEQQGADRLQGGGVVPTAQLHQQAQQQVPTAQLHQQAQQQVPTAQLHQQAQHQVPTAQLHQQAQQQVPTVPLHQQAQQQVPVAEELLPQIGPEALVCHEVDLDDLDEKEKPSSTAEHLLMMMREQKMQPPPPQQALPHHHLQNTLASPHPPHHPQPSCRPLPQAALPRPSPCVEESQVAVEDEVGAGSGESQEGQGANELHHSLDASSSSNSCSSSSSMSLQEAKDRGQKRLMDGNSSPSAKKQKRSQKRTNPPSRLDKNGAVCLCLQVTAVTVRT
ncbi:AT-rich interactive domain-containing protein 4A isoform 2-T4 [Polymixia lowei]